MMEEKTYLERLSDKIWNTKNARFVAFRRMKRCEFSSILATAMASVYIIVINLLSLSPSIVCRVNVHNANVNANILSIILSVLALVLALIVTLLNYGNRKNNYHSCGIELDHLNQKIQLRLEQIKNDNQSKENGEDEEFLNEYESILTSHNLNHTEFDYKYAQSSNEEQGNQNSSMKFVYWLRWNIFDVNMIYWCIIVLPGIILAIFYNHIVIQAM